jgi:hypothetical protein
MKKFMMMIALLAIPFAMQAQTKFHDVELNEATGPVKKISTQVMGMDQVTTFTQDGKMQRDGMSDAVYDADGYMQSCKMSIQGNQVAVSYKWENGRVISQSMDVMGQKMEIKQKYNDKGAVESQSMNMGGQEMSSPYTDYKYDAKGNWISRTASMMGQTMTQTRTIEYYE